MLSVINKISYILKSILDFLKLQISKDKTQINPKLKIRKIKQESDMLQEFIILISPK